MDALDFFTIRRDSRVKLPRKTILDLPVKFLLLLGCLSMSLAYASETSPQVNNSELANAEGPEFGIEIGALTLLGTDLRFFFRQPDSPWIVGFRFLDIEDDFMNEWAVGVPGDDSDREFTKRSGLYLDYLFDETGNESFYVSGAIYRTETTVVCSLGEGSDAASSLYFGGGFRKKWNAHIGYNIGLLLSPFVDLAVDANDCSSESEGDFDLNASLLFSF
jgi:hypothetical protein